MSRTIFMVQKMFEAIEVRLYIENILETRRSNFPSFPQYFLHVVRFSCLGRDQMYFIEDRKDIPKLSPATSWPGAISGYTCLEQMSIGLNCSTVEVHLTYSNHEMPEFASESAAMKAKLNPCPAEPGYILFCKQCRSRSVGFWRSQLIWICIVCHQVCKFITTIWIK